ncbi:MAG: MATE family efflux transporter [Aestuariivita sp.]|nr:MATE family efflux transporter [Aestuariivita sp.]MCY4203174.1 MATE family efflux transporter [Aestuariivita sp.]MCY4287765.1 MATE family efflux transporter [Aestuariivita sp.]MCY4345724.1 MATE family efflux transporter [Aestuariivita sp.]
MLQPQPNYLWHARASLLLGLPLIGGYLAQFAIGLTDAVMLGWYGVDALAAVTLAGTYLYVFFLLGAGFALAIMPMVAAYDAAGDQVGVRRSTRMGLWLSVVFSTAAIPLLWWSKPLLILLGQAPEIAQAAQDYLRIAGWSLFPMLNMMVLRSYLAALERAKVVLWMTVLSAVVNAIANYVLIFGYFGAPELGLQGAAISSVITQTVALVGMAIYALRVLPQHTLFARIWRLDWEMARRVFRLGLPIGVTHLSEVSLFAASALMMGWLGTIALAAHGIAVQLASAAFMVHLGLSNVATIRVAQAFAQADKVFAVRAAIAVIALSLVIAISTILVFLLAPEYLVGAFLEQSDQARVEIIALGTALLAVAALFQLVDGSQVIALGLLRGLQDTGVPMAIAGFSYIAVGIPASYLLGFSFGYGGIGIWLGLVIGLACAGCALMFRFWHKGLTIVGQSA